MSRTRRWLCSAVVAGAFVLVPVPNDAQTDHDQRRLDRFTGALEADGYTVTSGRVDLWNITRAWCEGTPGIEHAWYSNDAPYLVPKVPRSASDPEPVQEFQIGHDEAIVLIGRTPPPERYFAFYPFLSTKVYPDGQRRPLLIGVVDPLNHLAIKTAGPTPFDSEVALIFTPDRGADARVRAALRRAGYADAIVNTVVFPAAILNLGHGATADEFRIQLRNAMWEVGYEAAGDAYLARPPLRIFRVTPTSDGDADPFPIPPLRIRGTGRTELNLWNKLIDLRKRILDANPGLYATDIPVNVPVGYEGYDFMQRGALVGGDARDAFCLQAGYLPEFLSWDRQITLAEDEFLMVFGVNHVATGKTTYMSVGVYTGDLEDGKLSIGNVDDRRLAGTATPYLPGDPDANLMYAYKIARTCGGEARCLEVSAPVNCSRLRLDSGTVLGVMFRMYLEPATKSGAVMPEVLYDRVIKFSPRPSP